jgi:16S rRNA (uracil1498-N3)-methyltransferase
MTNKAKHSFFCEEIDGLKLSEEESHHAIRVLRLKENDLISLIDGKGRKSLGLITLAHKKHLEFSLVENFTEPAPNFHIHMGIAPTKNLDRFNFFIEKTVELGISRITPFITSNSERKSLPIDKLKKQILSAVKQSGNLYLPQLDELTLFKEFIISENLPEKRFIAHCEEDKEVPELSHLIPPNKKVLILIGPEGDFTREEINLALENNFSAVRLGLTRLRTETAGIIACHTVHVIS